MHKTDLAVQKLIAAATRRKARDAVDIALIDEKYIPLAAIAIAAQAKLENVSPIAILERALLNAVGHPMEDYQALRITHEKMPFPLSNIKTIVADKINIVIDIITKSCQEAEPGYLYISSKTRLPTRLIPLSPVTQ